MEVLLTSISFLICGIFHIGYAAPNVTANSDSTLSMKFIIDSPLSGVVTWDVDVSNYSLNHTVVRLLYRQEYDDDAVWTDLGLINLKEGLFIVDNLKYPYALTCVYLLPFDANVTYSDEFLGQICNRTFEDAPFEAPQDFMASCQVFHNDHTQREATFRWKPIPRQHQNGVILRYQLKLESKDCDLRSTFIIEPNTTMLHIQGGLSTRVTYLATLVAYNRKGGSPPTYYRLAPFNTVPHTDRFNTIFFILLVIMGIVMGAWWARHNPRFEQNTSTKKDLYKDSSAFRKRIRRVGVTQNFYHFSPLNNNV